MRIISGTAKGKRLAGPKSHLIRPVADKVKESIFNILGDISDLKVLDLFAGVGSVGLEAASRGAQIVYLVDQLPAALATIKKNAAICDFVNKVKIIKGRVPIVLTSIGRTIKSPFEIVFVDPPYDKNLVGETLEKLSPNNLIDENSTIIIEHSPREMPLSSGFEVTDQRKYGQTFVSFLRKL